jgi:hypothetical protein
MRMSRKYEISAIEDIGESTACGATIWMRSARQSG